jgi:hypothetical protein
MWFVLEPCYVVWHRTPLSIPVEAQTWVAICTYIQATTAGPHLIIYQPVLVPPSLDIHTHISPCVRKHQCAWWVRYIAIVNSNQLIKHPSGKHVAQENTKILLGRDSNSDQYAALPPVNTPGIPLISWLIWQTLCRLPHTQHRDNVIEESYTESWVVKDASSRKHVH